MVSFTLTEKKNHDLTRSVKLRSQLRYPIISADDHWGHMGCSLCHWCFWSLVPRSEKTKIGSMVIAALVSTLVGLTASNIGIIPYEARAYSIIMEFNLPLTVPLLLFTADLRHVRSTGTLLLSFLLGSVASIVGTVVAFLFVPMRSLGQDHWKIAAALMGSYVGGSVNYIAISEALGVSPSVLAAGVAADNVICALYFLSLFALASRIPPEASANDVAVDVESDSGGKLPVLQGATAVAISFLICKTSTYLTNICGIQGGSLPAITAVVVILATMVFFAAVGASGSIWNVINTATSIFVFALVQVTVHLAVIPGLGKLFRFDLKLLLLASNANIGGPTTACGMATAKGWGSLIVPAILASIAIATFLGIAVNYIAISEALGISPSVLAAGVAADDVICALYFLSLFALASRIPLEASTNDVAVDVESNSVGKLPVLQVATAVAISFLVCKTSTYLTNICGIQGGSLPAITAVVVILATVFPTQFGFLALASETIALVLMQVIEIFPVKSICIIWKCSYDMELLLYGVNAYVAPSIFMFALVQVTVHLAVILGLGKLFRFDLRLLLLASNANIGGPTTACGMATAKGWGSLIVPAILAGNLEKRLQLFLALVLD
uniref:Uncharacterized protein n=1 Tax=Quercus lobata TaxID=97700 RepID=A0A7N2MIM0_QUELO